MSADLREFFADYCKAYDDYDAERIASFFHCPMLTVRQGKVILLETPEEILGFFSKLLDWYREIKYTKGVISAFEARPLGPNGAIVHILWSPTRADGTVISRFPQTYNLVSVDGHWKIFVSSRHEYTATVLPDLCYEGVAQPRVRADGRKRASLACGARLATLLGRRSTRALGLMSIGALLSRASVIAFLVASFGSFALMFIEFGGLFRPLIVLVWIAWVVTVIASPAAWIATGVLGKEPWAPIRAEQPARFWIGFATYTILLLVFFIAASLLLLRAYRGEAQPSVAADPLRRAPPAFAGR